MWRKRTIPLPLRPLLERFRDRSATVARGSDKKCPRRGNPLAGVLSVNGMWILALVACAPSATAEDAPPSVLPDGCVADVTALPASPLYDRADARLQGDDLVVVRKAARVAMRFRDGALVTLADGQPACWRVALAAGLDVTVADGPKRRRGDLRTPEGWYRTSDKPWSKFYGAILVHYPNEHDVAAGLEAGLVDRAGADALLASLRRGEAPSQQTRLGGDILLHGGGSGYDWTLGCVAFEDAELDALRATLPAGMRADLLILP